MNPNLSSPPEPIEVTERQAGLLRRFVKRATADPTLPDLPAIEMADWNEAVSIILRLAGAEHEAEQARHVAAVIREAADQQLLLGQMLHQIL